MRLTTYTEKQIRMAKRLWDGKVPRKDICRLMEIPEATLKDWRYRFDWPPRNQWSKRPVRNPAKRRGVKHTKGTKLGPTPQCYACAVCGGRSPTPVHASHGAAA